MVDVTVMGAGILGLSAAWEMARRGARVRVIERERVGAGSSGGVVGALAPHVPENWNAKKAMQLDSLLMAEAFWQGVTEAGGGDAGYARLGRIQPLDSDEAVALARMRETQAQSLWRGKAEWRVVDGVEGLPIRSRTGLFVHDTLSARIRPMGALDALQKALSRHGVPIEVGDVSPQGTVLWATGAAGLHELSVSLGRKVGVGIKGQAALLAADWRNAPQLFVDGLHVVPHADGTVAIGSTTERDFDDARATDGQLDDIIARARAACPALAEAAVLQRWAGLRPRARSRGPVLGAWPGRPGHAILNGGFKIGFGMAPILAALAADLVLNGRAEIPAEFDPSAL